MSRAFGKKGHDMKMQFVLLLEERTDFTAKQQKMEEETGNYQFQFVPSDFSFYSKVLF